MSLVKEAAGCVVLSRDLHSSVMMSKVVGEG